MKLVSLGRVEKAHGLRGELRIRLYADAPFVFENLRRIYLQLPTCNPRPCAVEGWREHQGRALVALDRCQGRDQAELWRGAEVLAREDDVPKRETSDFDKMDGFRVERLSGEPVGVLEETRNMAGREIWVIRDAESREILIPAVAEFVREIDEASRLIRIDPPAGLIELYQEEA